MNILSMESDSIFSKYLHTVLGIKIQYKCIVCKPDEIQSVS